jgi:hypothetical protein
MKNFLTLIFAMIGLVCHGAGLTVGSMNGSATNLFVIGGNISGSVNSNQVLNVLDFGVDNTGTTTNTTTIGNAMSAAQDGRRRVLQFPQGIYKISSPLYITNHNVSIEALGLVILVQTTDGADTICITNFQGAAFNYPFIGGSKFVIDPGYFSGMTNSGIGMRVYGVGGGSVDGGVFDNMQIIHCAVAVKYQEVSNSRFFGTIEKCGIGFESTNNGNANFVYPIITECSVGMIIHGGRGWTIIAGDFGAPNMTNAIVFDGASYGTLIGGNFEMYGGDIAPFKTTGSGGAVWTFQNVNLPSGFIGSQADYSFAFTDSGANASSFIFDNCFFQHGTNVGGRYEQVLINNIANQRAFSTPLPMSAVLYSGGVLKETNAWVSAYQSSYTTLASSQGQLYFDFATLPPRLMISVPIDSNGTLDQANILQYYLDRPSVARTNISNRFNFPQAFQNTAQGSGIFVSQTNIAGGSGTDSSGGAIAFRGYDNTFSFGQLIWFYPTGASWSTVLELAPNGDSADNTTRRGLFGVWGLDGTTRISNLRATNANILNGTFNGTYSGDGTALTGINATDSRTFNTNLFSGFNFPLTTNTVSTITTATNILLSGIDFSSANNGRWGELIIRTTANITVTNPPSWFTSDGLRSRTVFTNQVLIIVVEAVPGFLTNAAFTILQ